MRRRAKIVWLSNLDSQPVQLACEAMNADFVRCEPEKAATLSQQLLDVLIVDLRSSLSFDLVDIGSTLKTDRPPRVILVVSDEHIHSVDRIEAAKPDGILNDPLSLLQTRLVIGIALRSHAPARRPAPASKPLADVTPLAPLTRRETDVLALFLNGHRVKSIARACFISEGTVRAHLKSVFRKFDVGSQAELMDYLLKKKKAAAGA
jgi:DNA-binding NarL/FixJ family response regulator